MERSGIDELTEVRAGCVVEEAGGLAGVLSTQVVCNGRTPPCVQGLSKFKKGSLMLEADATELKGLSATQVQDVMHDQHDFGPDEVVVDVDVLLSECVRVWFEQEQENVVRTSAHPSVAPPRRLVARCHTPPCCADP